MLLDGLNAVEVSNGVLGCLDTCHHLDQGQFLITTDTSRSFSCRSLWKENRKSGVGKRFFNALSSP